MGLKDFMSEEGFKVIVGTAADLGNAAVETLKKYQPLKVQKDLKEALANTFPVEGGYNVVPLVSYGLAYNLRIFDLALRKEGCGIKNIAVFKKRPLWRETEDSFANGVLRDGLSYAVVIYGKSTDDNLEISLYERGSVNPTPMNSCDELVRRLKEIEKKLGDQAILTSSDVQDKEQEDFAKDLVNPEWCRRHLDVLPEKMICRFTSLDSLFFMIKNQTLRMNGLPGMNDKGEGLFAWNMVSPAENTVENRLLINRKKLVNDAFITSFSVIDKKENLAQWQIYGNDAKGVCLVFSVKDEVSDRFFLHPIRYLDTNGVSCHKKGKDGLIMVEDDLINKMKDLCRSEDARYSDLSPLIFYYKDSKFASEDEVRLLFDNKKSSAYKSERKVPDWLLTNANNIPNPYIDVPLEEIPIKLEEIIIGRRMDDPDTVQAQIETLLEQKGMKDVVVELSEITFYR